MGQTMARHQINIRAGALTCKLVRREGIEPPTR